MIRKAALLLLALATTPAHAHGSLPGGGGFYAGAAHPFVSIDHLIVLLALGLVLAQRDMRVGLGVLIISTAIGLALPLASIRLEMAGPMLFFLAVLTGGSVALARHFPAHVTLVLSAAVGLCIGLQTDVPLEDTVQAATAGAGVLVAVFLIAAYAMAIGTAGRHKLHGIPLRVAGSWIVAIALLMLAFHVRGVSGGLA